MKERPILFSAPMVRAILDGAKSQTRRIMKPQADTAHDGEPYWFVGGYRAWTYRNTSDVLRKGCNVLPCPYGKPGDRLYVRETWRYRDWTEDGEPEIEFRAGGKSCLFTWEQIPVDWVDRLTDTWADLSDSANYAINQRAADRHWRPAIHMPRWASRITLEITGIRVERLQDVGEADAVAEGVKRRPLAVSPSRTVPTYWDYLRNEPSYRTARDSFSSLWESINGPGSWAANPCVWVVEFRRMK